MTANAPAWLLGRAIYIDGVTRPTTRPCDTDDGDSVAPAGLSPAFRTQPSRNHKVAVALAHLIHRSGLAPVVGDTI
jgi:hypothetical protein